MSRPNQAFRAHERRMVERSANIVCTPEDDARIKAWLRDTFGVNAEAEPVEEVAETEWDGPHMANPKQGE